MQPLPNFSLLFTLIVSLLAISRSEASPAQCLTLKGELKDIIDAR